MRHRRRRLRRNRKQQARCVPSLLALIERGKRLPTLSVRVDYAHAVIPFFQPFGRPTAAQAFLEIVGGTVHRPVTLAYLESATRAAYARP